MCGQARWGACNGHLGKRSERISGRSAHGSVGFALGRVLGPLMAVEHCLREAGAGGSNPLTPTSIFLGFLRRQPRSDVSELTLQNEPERERVGTKWAPIRKAVHVMFRARPPPAPPCD